MRRFSTIAVVVLFLLMSLCHLTAQQSTSNSWPISTVMNGPCPGFSNPLPGFIPRFAGISWICNSVIFQSGGNIGIRTINPSTTLDVNGPINTATYYDIFGVRALAITNGNTSVGQAAGFGDGGVSNVAVGLQSNFDGSGSNNTFVGTGTASIGETGSENTYLGANAGFNHEVGDHNIFIGYNTGTQGSLSNNIYLDARCSSCDLDHPENNTIRVGTAGRQTDTYIAGIYHASINTPNEAICIDADGKLASVNGACTIGSSRRFKNRVLDMGDRSEKLFRLRPVTFFYKPQYDDGSHAQQYGLIAEEVASFYPELVSYDKEGQPYGIKYQLFIPMLLNELQKEHAVVMAQQDELRAQRQQMQAQRQATDDLKLQLERQNASWQVKYAALEEHLMKLESYVTAQTKTASVGQQPAVSAGNGGLQ